MPSVRIRTPHRLAGLLVVSAALVLSAAACSSGSDASDTAQSGTGTGTGTGQGRTSEFAAYTACLQKNGVTITMPSGGPRTRPSDGAGRPSGFPSGMPRPSGSAGAGQRGGGFPGGGGMFNKPDNVSQDTWDKAQSACASVRPSFGGGGQGRGGNGANAAYRNCLQHNGVTLTEGGISTTDPNFAKADAKCKVLKPTASATPTA